MIEMSATAVPPVAQAGAVLAAAPALAGSEGAQIADFSTVLAGAALVAQMPEPAIVPEPQTPAPIVPELAAAAATQAGKAGMSGREPGKMLPAGKVPVARDVAVGTKAQRAILPDETETEPTSAHDMAPAEQPPVDTPVQTTPAAPTLTPTPVLAEQTATVPPERSVPHDAPQSNAEPAPAPHASVGTRQSAPLRSTTTAIPIAEQTAAPESPLTTPAIISDLRSAAAVKTPAAMSGNTADVSAYVTSDAAPRDTPAEASRETNARTLRYASPVLSNAASASLTAAAADSTAPAVTAVVVPQASAVASTPTLTGTASVSVPAPFVSTEAALVATTAGPLVQARIALPSAIPAQADGSTADVTATDVGAPALARASAAAAAAPALSQAPPTAEALASVPASASSSAQAPVTAKPTPIAPAEDDIVPNAAKLAAAPISLGVPNVATSSLQAASVAIIAPVPPATREAVRPQASDGLTIAAPVPSMPALDQGKAAIPVEATVTAPAANASRDAAVAVASPPGQTLQQALTAPLAATPTTAATPLAAVLPVAAPDVAIQQAAANAPVEGQVRAKTPIAAPPALAAAEPVEHRRPLPVAATDAPAAVSRPEPVSIVTGNDMRTAAIFAAPSTAPTATTPTQDIAALVDRITEARAAAAPNTIRAALVHEDFGSVSLNFRTEASHIHVTLGSADPGFAPAVQAAAAANLAGNTSDDAQNRRQAPATQSNPQSQDATRNDASSQQQQAQRDRANAGERQQPSRQATSRQPANSGERTSTAAEPRRRNGIFA